MKKYMILILFLCVYTAYAQDNIQDSLCDRDCKYEILLKNWYNGTNGQKQGPVDSVILQKIEERFNTNIDLTPSDKDDRKMREIVENLRRYRGLGIFPIDNINSHIEDGVVKVLKGYYNVDIDYERISSRYYGPIPEKMYIMGYTLVQVYGLPNYENMVYLESNATREVLSTYKYKRRSSPRDSSTYLLYASLLREWELNSIEQRLPPWSRWRLNKWGRIPETKKNIDCATALTVAAGAATEYSGSKMTPLWGMPIQYNYEEDHWIVSCAKDTSRLHDYYRERKLIPCSRDMKFCFREVGSGLYPDPCDGTNSDDLWNKWQMREGPGVVNVLISRRSGQVLAII